MPNWSNVSVSTADGVHVDILTSAMMAAGKLRRGGAGINMYIENFTDPTKITVLDGIYDQDAFRVIVP